MYERLGDTDPWHSKAKGSVQNLVASIAVNRFDINGMTSQMRRPISTTHSVVVLNTADTAGDDERHTCKRTTVLQQFKRALLHGLNTKPTATPAFELAIAEVYHRALSSRPMRITIELPAWNSPVLQPAR